MSLCININITTIISVSTRLLFLHSEHTLDIKLKGLLLISSWKVRWNFHQFRKQPNYSYSTLKEDSDAIGRTNHKRTNPGKIEELERNNFHIAIRMSSGALPLHVAIDRNPSDTARKASELQDNQNCTYLRDMQVYSIMHSNTNTPTNDGPR
jgi:hypothetical protein